MTENTLQSGAAGDELVELGRTAGAYGFRGWVRVQPLETGEVLEAVRNWVLVDMTGTRTPVCVKGLRRHGTGLIAKWDGCESKEEADRLRVKIGVMRSDFPEAGEDAVWAVDLEGCTAVSREGAELGVIRGVTSNGAQDLFVVEYRDEAGEHRSFLVPNVRDVYVVEINTADRRVVLDWDPSWR